MSATSSLTSRLERWCRAHDGAYRLSYEPALSSPWHGSVASDDERYVAAGQHRVDVLRSLVKQSGAR